MTDVEDLEVKIKEAKTKLVSLEDLYEKEENEAKASKLEYRISRQDEVVDKLIDRQDALLNKEDADAQNNGKDKNKEEEDETVCPECGSDLYEEDEGVLYCEKCGEYYEVTENE